MKWRSKNTHWDVYSGRNIRRRHPRLRDLRELGITAVELMPATQFPGSRNWGYDRVYPYVAQAS
jgi:1,4-alpha-glucan branching enzyme